jgi:four helix bundle protein
MADIAEAFGRYHHSDKNKFYYNARGSLEELKSQLLIIITHEHSYS